MTGQGDKDRDSVAYLPMHLLAECLRNGALSASALLDIYLRRIRRHDQKLHAFIAVYENEARAAAERADHVLKSGPAPGPLFGIPIALKDLIDVEGRVTTGGSLIWRDRLSPVTATAVRRLTDAGMIVLGKTHLVEFAFGAWGTNKAMGTPWNPWDPATARVPGGSSSGSAVAVAAALAPAALGSDTGGSVRAPAGLCGIVGLKTTVGRISNHGVLGLSATLDTLGPMTRDVEDAALLFAAMHGPDPADAQTLQHPQVDVLASLKAGIAGQRIAVLPEADLEQVDDEVMHAFREACNVMRRLGARIDTLELPQSFQTLAEWVGKIIATEGYALHGAWIERDDLPFDPDVCARLRLGKTVSAGEYDRIMAERKIVCEQVDRLLGNFDALLVPTVPMPAIPLTDVDQSQAPMSRLTRPVNLLDLCALALPCGYTRNGLPVSMQVIGRGYEEARVLRIGWAYENATDWHTRRPPDS